MTVKSRLLATALAISLATPAAAVTITLSTSTSYLPRTAFQILGPETFTDGFFVGLAGSVLIPAPPVLEPAGGDMTKYGDWDYAVDYFAFYPNQVPWIGPGGVVASGCY